MVKGVFNSCRRVCGVGDGNHSRRDLVSRFFPIVFRRLPVFTQEQIGILYQVRERITFFRFAVDIVFYGIIHIDVIKPGTQIIVNSTIVTDNHAGGFYKP